MRLTYFNNSADALYEVKLRLHPNDVSPGCMGVSDVAANNEAAYYTLGGTNESILSVSLPGEIAPGGSAEIYLRFEIGLPATGNRFGVNETGIMLGNFLPIAAVYENGAWREDGYTREGDAFYSECADYRVSVSAPAKWELAHTGSLVESKEENGVSTWYIAAPKSRDFALALMKEPYVETRQSAAGTAVTAFGTSKKRAVYSADAAVAALDYFSRNIGTYPYDTFFVVPFDMGGGMEYPGLVMLCERDLHGDDLSGAALVIGHEAAHQWFYSVVGSDQINAPVARRILRRIPRSTSCAPTRRRGGSSGAKRATARSKAIKEPCASIPPSTISRARNISSSCTLRAARCTTNCTANSGATRSSRRLPPISMRTAFPSPTGTISSRPSPRPRAGIWRGGSSKGSPSPLNAAPYPAAPAYRSSASCTGVSSRCGVPV